MQGKSSWLSRRFAGLVFCKAAESKYDIPKGITHTNQNQKQFRVANVQILLNFSSTK